MTIATALKEHLEADPLVGAYEVAYCFAPCPPLPVRDLRQVCNGRIGLGREFALAVGVQLYPDVFEVLHAYGY